jgi:hypothetical protein
VRIWIKKKYREHPWLTIALGVYLVLSAVELTRILLYDGPRSYEAGLYPWELAPAPVVSSTAANAPSVGSVVVVGFAGGELTRGPMGRAGGAPGIDPHLAWQWLEDQRPPSGPDSTLPFRWTRNEAYLLKPVMGPILVVPFYLARPDIPGPEVPVRIALEVIPGGNVVLGNFVLTENGWDSAAWFLPPLLGEQAWDGAVTGWQEVVEAESQAQAMKQGNWFARWFDNWRHFKPWQPPPGRSLIGLHVLVGNTFVPADLLEGSDDQRRLGVGIGDLAWRSELPAEGFGFHPWETTPEGFGFSWTRLRASLPLEVESDELSFRLRADHPDIATNPVVTRIYWGATQLRSVSIDASGWHEVVLRAPDPEGSRAVLTISVDRTWTPADKGVSNDTRELGVAMTKVKWR